ncbi:hypothetical protein ACMA1D_14400 [Streptomyces sp. 796.1]|uniref:hypothetical protein n=1 Tax=unclassified Streptomyces TaxID=2593676 RepID=UPI0032EE2CB8
MQHTMTLKVYRQRPGEPPIPLAAPTTIRIDPESLTRSEFEAQLCSTAWAPCRCPRHRQEGAASVSGREGRS